MRKLILVASLLCLALSAHAAPPSTESIETLLAATKVESLLGAVYSNMEKAMRAAMGQQLAGKGLTSEQQRFLDTVPGRFTNILKDELSWSRIKPIYVQIYQESFTQEEIDGLVAFYQSPAGKAFVDKMPVVMQKSMAAMQSRLQPMMERMNTAVEQAIAEAKAIK